MFCGHTWAAHTFCSVSRRKGKRRNCFYTRAIKMYYSWVEEETMHMNWFHCTYIRVCIMKTNSQSKISISILFDSKGWKTSKCSRNLIFVISKQNLRREWITMSNRTILLVMCGLPMSCGICRRYKLFEEFILSFSEGIYRRIILATAFVITIVQHQTNWVHIESGQQVQKYSQIKQTVKS